MTRKVLSLVLLIAILMLSACNGGNKINSSEDISSLPELEVLSESANSSDITTSDTSTASISDSTSSTGKSTGKSTAASSKTVSTGNNNTAQKRTLYVKDFGAVGDGKSNDGPALLMACGELMQSAPGSTLVLESNKTYYVKNSGSGIRAALYISGGTNLTIKGNNTTILADPENGMFYAEIKNTKGFTLEGLNFNYSTKPFFLGTTISIDASKNTAIMTADRPLSPGMKTGDTYTGLSYGIPETPTGRAHMYIDRIEVLDGATRKIKIYFKNTNNFGFINFLKTYKFIGPMPNVGFKIERAFTIESNTDFTMKNCNTYSFTKFHMALFGSEGTVRFINTNIIPDPNDAKVDFTGWCDGYHVKENRAKIIWDNCKATGMTDDVFNISASALYVKSVFSGNDIDLYWPEMKTVYRPIKVGDELTIIDTETGKLIGRTTVSRVVAQTGTTNRIKLKDNLGTIPTGEHVHAFFDSMVAPGSEIKNSDFDGTFRFRGPITITNTKFQIRRMWIDMYRNLEGPVPRNIIFKNCDIRADGPGTIEIKSYNPNPTAPGAYKLENIVFEGCKNLKQSDFDIGAGVNVTIR